MVCSQESDCKPVFNCWQDEAKSPKLIKHIKSQNVWQKFKIIWKEPLKTEATELQNLFSRSTIHITYFLKLVKSHLSLWISSELHTVYKINIPY